MTTICCPDSLASGLCQTWGNRTRVQSCKVIQVAVTSNFERLINWDLWGGVCVYFLVCFGLLFVYSGVTLVQTQIPQNLPGRPGHLVLEAPHMEGTKNILSQHQNDI